MRLLDFGFQNFNINNLMLDRNPDINIVAELLMQGQVHEDIFKELENIDELHWTDHHKKVKNTIYYSPFILSSI